MRHLLNVLRNWLWYWSPLLWGGGFVIGLVWGAVYVIDTYGY